MAWLSRLPPPHGLLLAGLLLLSTTTATGSDSPDSGPAIATGTTISNHVQSIPSGPYATYSTTALRAGILDTRSNLQSASSTSSSRPNSNRNSPGGSTAATTVTDLVGTRALAPPSTVFRANESHSLLLPSSSAAVSTLTAASNTQPCNGHVEFCQRRYSNITHVAAHNSPFIRAGSAAANQRYGATDQLNHGIRLLQGQMHLKNGTPHLCHSSCDMLDAGPLADWLVEIKAWLDTHRFDVVTILIGNADPYPDPSTWVFAVEQSGILDYAYAPPQMPMSLADWPTLADMILLNRRAVILLDYKANYATWPWLIDEFAVMWETPFDPVNRDFPCTVERPPDLSESDARSARMFMMNHNFNVQFDILGTSILVPARSLLNETNAVAGYGSVGAAAAACRAAWGRPPNFLNVDYYDEGSSPGSVFEVAAAMNGVEYTGDCCGITAAAPLGTALPTGRALFWVCVLSVVLSLLMA